MNCSYSMIAKEEESCIRCRRMERIVNIVKGKVNSIVGHTSPMAKAIGINQYVVVLQTHSVKVFNSVQIKWITQD